MLWIQWNHILPRITLFAVVVLAVELGVGPAIRWAIVSRGERVVGAKVDVASVTASVVGTKVSLRGFQVVDPGDPQKKLVEADQLDLKFEGQALLRKKAIASHGTLRGLRLGSLGRMRGELPAKLPTRRSGAA